MAGRFLLAGAAAAARETTLRVAGVDLVLAAFLATVALALGFDAFSGARFRAAGLFAERARAAGFLAVRAFFAAVLRFGAVRFRLAAFLAAAGLRPAVFRPPAFLAPAAERRRVARAAFRLAMRRPFQFRLCRSDGGQAEGRSYLDSNR